MFWMIEICMCTAVFYNHDGIQTENFLGVHIKTQQTHHITARFLSKMAMKLCLFFVSNWQTMSSFRALAPIEIYMSKLFAMFQQHSGLWLSALKFAAICMRLDVQQ